EGEPAHGAGHGEPHLAASFRPWNRRHQRQLRDARRTAVASRPARLSGDTVRRQRLVGQEAAPSDRAVEYVPAIVALERCGPAARSRESAALVVSAAASLRRRT